MANDIFCLADSSSGRLEICSPRQVPGLKSGPEAEEAKLKATAAQDRSDLEKQLKDLRQELQRQQGQEAQERQVSEYK